MGLVYSISDLTDVETLFESTAFTSQGSQSILKYDEHELNNTYKFGVIYQKFGQVSDTYFLKFNQYMHN